MVAENEPRLGDVVSKKCPLAISMRSQGRSVAGVRVIPYNMAKGAMWVGGSQGSAGNNGKDFKNHWNNFETPECSHDKGKCKYMGD